MVQMKAKDGVEQNSDWQATACILCSLNCGIEIQVDEERHFKRIRGDKKHPQSQGYLCQKAARLEHYQHHARRVTQPLRRRPDGTFEAIDWDTAVTEIADKLKQLRDTYGGHSIAYYGGGGQGNHLGGAYASAFRAALGTPYLYNSLAQEKTGDFWVNGKLFGRQTCHTSEGIEDADYAIIFGANPFQAHGFARARHILRAISKDPNRTLVVVDPRRTKTAELADIHLQVKPGMDAFLMAAMLGVIVQEGLIDQTFITEHTVGFEAVQDMLQAVPVADYAAKAGLDPALVRTVARDFAQARRATTHHDLGLEHSLHSTLNSYLEKLLFLMTGNFGKEGGNNLHTQFVPLIGHSREPEEGGITTKVTGMKEISKLFPPNILPAEIDTDHPERTRAVFVDSSNPLQSAADTQAYRCAFAKLDLLVVVDVAMTETAEMAHYILPAPTQYEKWEATFFTLSFPTNYFHVRRPILEPVGDTLPEPEIYYRLMVALGAIPESFPELEAAAHQYRQAPESGSFLQAFFMTLAQHREWKPYSPIILYATLGKALPEGAASTAVLWGTAQYYAQQYAKQVRRAGHEGEGHLLGENLFNRIVESDTGVAISTHAYDEVWELVRHRDQKVHLDVPEMLADLQALAAEAEADADDAFPFVLAAGERRSYNANQIYRDPAWRRNDPDGALRIHPDDALAVGLVDGGKAVCESAVGSIDVCVAVDDAMRPGFLSLPHGYGMTYPDPLNPDRLVENGPRINLLTSADHCDPLAKTPYHKYVPVRLRPLTGR